MALKNRITHFLFYYVVGTAYAFALSHSILVTTVLDISAPFVLFLSALFLLVFFLLFFDRYTTMVTAGLLIAGGGGIYLSLRRNGFQAAWYRQLRGAADGLLDFILDRAPFQEGYDFAIAVGVVMLVTLFIALNTQLCFRFFLLAVLGINVLAVPVLLDYHTSPAAHVLAVACFVVFLSRKLGLLAAAPLPKPAKPPRKAPWREKRALRKTQRQEKFRLLTPVHILTLLPLAALVTGMAWLLPKPSEPLLSLNWTPLLDGEGSFTGSSVAADIRTMSFKESETELGGSMQRSNMTVLEVFSEEPLYIGGVIRNTYTGTSWTMDEQGRQPLSSGKETAYAVSDYTPELQQLHLDYLTAMDRQARSATIRIQGLRTKAVFIPPYSTGMQFSESVHLFKNTQGALSLGSALRSPAEYTVQYLSWDFRDDRLAGLLRERSTAPLTDAMQEYLAPYLQLPGKLPARVPELAEQLAGGEGNSYDQLMSLLAHLSSYPYTLSPGELPEGEDFVDYFLFTGERGYCTYYASALAVMGRCLGIPTRYIEGYITPRRPDAQTGAYTVTSAQAHAWVEAYFPGFGWVPFEATAPYSYGFYGSEAPSPSEIFAEDVLEEYPDHIDELGYEAEAQPSVPASPENGDEAASPGSGQPLRDKADRSGLPAGITAAVLLLLVALAGWRGRDLLYCLRLARADRLSPTRVVPAYFALILSTARERGLPILPYETACGWAQRAALSISLDGEDSLAALAEVYTHAAYSGEPAGRNAALRMRSGCQDMRAQLYRYRRGRFGRLAKALVDRLRRRPAKSSAP